MKISIVVASYNYADYIEETIKSVINQTYSDWELVIVDDGSSDDSLQIIEKYCNQDNRIKLYTHPNHENKGLKETLLLGISKAESEWVAFLESDDSLREDYLEKKADIANKYPEIGLIFNGVEFIGDEYQIKYRCNGMRKSMKEMEDLKYPSNIFKKLNVRNKIVTFSTVMVKKEFLKREYFETPEDRLLDWWLYIHILYCTMAYYLPENLTNWRIHENSYIKIKRKGRKRFVQIRAYLDIYKANKNEKWIPIFAIYSLILYILSTIKRTIRYLIVQTIRFIKRLLGLPLKEL